ncbi:LLM class flavin-dependent oxidoreductase [Pseudonocardia nigra]|uniref:LLM class flavin-dependent oxidoreductase n=1 Tax=Pseudonocardia nigra TaxID=1921578 RepID=UPI001C60287D|nr:LLM class flavin-dependent oxidoreductase [Pseudonocardia nigra]
MSGPVKFAVPFDHHRSTPISAIASFTSAMQASGVDFLWLYDEFSWWFPGKLWSKENTPFAEIIDGHSTHDPFVHAAFALSANPTASVRLTTDAVRASPVELLRKMLTLAHGTEGDVICAIGAGEQRHAKPFGYKRSEGLKRLEDVFVLLNKLWDADEPVSYEGNFWNYQNAFIGTTRPAKRPEFWALGGGPKLLEIAAKYADGFEAATPQAIANVAKFAAQVTSLRQQVESHGRDPEAFGFGIWNICICHDDPDVIEQVLQNPIAKYYAAQFGRLNGADWAEEGIQPVMPKSWHYALHWLPFEQTDAELDAITSSVSTDMVRKSFNVGSPQEIAAINSQFIDAGARFVGHLDMTPLIVGPSDAEDSIRRALEVNKAVKAHAGTKAQSS